ncbi:hypothetical protein BX600DRAFT_258685 [Xylariales sp. PMI_506]|nr:hypothetical protein BX600DRAFT_258685 [Xylariales sp. PMI_506]
MLLGPFNSSGTWDGWQSQDLLHIVNIIQALRMWSVTDDNAQLKLPNPSKISFVLPGAAARASGIANGHTDSVLGFPIPSPDLRAGLWSGKERCFFPCTSQSWKEWYKAQTRSAVREMLEGEWFGYYTYWLYSARDDPMQSIRFQLVREHEDAYEIEALECFDGIGQFTLRGQVNLTDGTIQLHKDYASHGFAWRGRVTPLGICGCYSTITDFDIDTDGAFWLWKREWMDEDEEQNC